MDKRCEISFVVIVLYLHEINLISYLYHVKLQNGMNGVGYGFFTSNCHSIYDIALSATAP